MNAAQQPKRSSTRRLLDYAKPHSSRFALALLLMVFATAAEMSIPWLVKVILDEVILPGNFAWSELLKLGGIMFAMYVVAGLLQYLQVLNFQHGALSVVNALRRDLFAHLLKLPMRVFDSQPVGRLVSRVSNDTESLRDLFVSVLPTIIQGSLRIVAIFIAISLLDWRLMLLSLVLIPILLGAMQLYRKLSAPLFNGARERISEINTQISESLQGMRIIQAFNQQAHSRAEFEQTNQAWSQVSRRTIGLNSLLLAPYTRLIALLASVVVVAWFGQQSGLTADVGAVEIGSLYAFMIYLERFFDPFRQLSMELSKLQISTVAADRVFELLDEAADPHADASIPLRPGTQSERHSPASEIVFDNVSLSYDGQHQALNEISFTAPAGKMTAIVGHSGSGKSSLINLLMRFYEHQQGEVRIDGQPLSQFNDADLRQRFGLVQQEPVIFSGSIDDNIRLGRDDLSEAAVQQAAQQGQAQRFIHRLPGGFAHRPGNAGQSLSMGERQLLAFARTLAHAPGVLLLDEATANIDSETEEQIKRALANLRQGRTTLAIAHRLSTIVDADQILVMDQGRIVQRGTHAELVEQAGHYRELYLAQQVEEELTQHCHGTDCVTSAE
ncbi:ABC transporter ATP-binding protein [Ferrimonas pelagia]|uniref:ABC transporter ATP-binding protein n=1 Tax=Ferrimonas pelagia TaxID=1177826 RepID=A0ABP9FB61_9GAMM